MRQNKPFPRNRGVMGIYLDRVTRRAGSIAWPEGKDQYLRDLVLIAAYNAGLLEKNCAEGYHPVKSG